jgi:hypothetical protein
MAYVAGEERGDEKFRLILSRVASIRLRLNALAVQHGLFGALTFVLCAAVMVVASAFLFGALTFLLLALAVTIIALGGVVRMAGGAWRMRASDERAARIADERAELKGRLTTMVGASHGGARSGLWPYLVEDTLSLREEYAVPKIEPRRVSRWLYAALASGVAAALVFNLAFEARQARLIARKNATRGEASVDLGNLDIRPADPSLAQGTQIDADPATLRKLANELRAAQSQAQSPTSRLMADARDVASALQNKLTGGQPPTLAPKRLRITDNTPGGLSPGKSSSNLARNERQGASGHGAGQNNATNGKAAAGVQPGHAMPNPGLPNLGGMAGLSGRNEGKSASGSPSGKPQQNPTSLAKNGSEGGGAGHGYGSDPNDLFGAAQRQKLGNDTFKIPIDVGPSDQGFGKSAPAYIPSRVKTALNASQYPDEPFERASIPASDRVTIKRVFER